MPQQQVQSAEAAGGGGMPRRRAEEYSGVAILVLCLGLGVMVYVAGADPSIPGVVWLGLLAACVAGLFVAGDLRRPLRLRWAAYAASVICSWGVILSLPPNSIGMLVVLMVVVASVGSYVVPFWATALVVGLNMAVILGMFLAHQVEMVETLVSSAFFLIIHLAAAFSTYALHRESVVRAELEEKNVELTAASVLLEDSAKTSERLRISRELHDLIGHQLTVLNLELEAAKHRQGEQVRPHLERASEVAKELLADVRSTVGELREADHGDLRAAVERVAAAVPSLEIHLEVSEEVAVDEEQAAVLLRAVQEILTNTVKHADADELTVEIVHADGQIRLTGVNDGHTVAEVIPGHGLQGLRERVELLGGRLEVTPRPWFTVEVSLPGRDGKDGLPAPEAGRSPAQRTGGAGLARTAVEDAPDGEDRTS